MSRSNGVTLQMDGQRVPQYPRFFFEKHYLKNIYIFKRINPLTFQGVYPDRIGEGQVLLA